MPSSFKATSPRVYSGLGVYESLRDTNVPGVTVCCGQGAAMLHVKCRALISLPIHVRVRIAELTVEQSVGEIYLFSDPETRALLGVEDAPVSVLVEKAA